MISQSLQKKIRALQRKKKRYESGRFLIEGTKIASEALTQDHLQIHNVICTDEIYQKESLNISKEKLHIAEPDQLQKLSGLSVSPGILVELSMHEEEELDASKTLFYLDGIRDPGNLGAIMRISDWYGWSQIWLSSDCVDPYNLKSVQASMGSILRVKPKIVSHELLLSHADQIYSADLNGQDLSASSISMPSICVIGSESHGVRFSHERVQPLTISSQRSLGAESLNASIAAGIMAQHWSVQKQH